MAFARICVNLSVGSRGRSGGAVKKRCGSMSHRVRGGEAAVLFFGVIFNLSSFGTYPERMEEVRPVGRYGEKE